ncbi:acyltransferase family protein [Altererythrobacter indicus]|uniref:Acyltransferase family protein n=1 Tax=Altericroceibacterium indicum TaxID=374177 RepID=A0A845ABY5_9SPHN|nr:acyltransferase [Altericroceibacterium indicum]MXP27017.1 acyltransferase family protein [Altericroceibacterium indicum]
MSQHQPTPPTSQNHLDSVQYLRAGAAIFVLIGHAMSAAVSICSAGSDCSFQRPNWATGSGVDLFFIISGFIMVISSKKLFQAPDARKRFIARRLSRIIPLYWACTTLFIMLSLLLSKTNINIFHVLSSYLFFPWDADAATDGFASPLYSLGWTLNYEMAFYVIFSSFIFLDKKRAISCTGLAIIIMVAIGCFTPKSYIPLYFWTRPIILEFILGVVLGYIYTQRSISINPVFRIILLLPILLLIINPIIDLQAARTPNSLVRVIGWGLPMFCIMLSAISGPVPLPKMMKKFLGSLGDASYSLYLIHPFCIVFSEKVYSYAVKNINMHLSIYVFFISTLILSFIFSLISYTFFEKKIDSKVRSILFKRFSLA